MAELTAFVVLAKLSMRHEHAMCPANDIKQKRLLGGNQKKIFKFAFFFLYLLFFTFYFMFVILLYSFSFISTLRTILCLKCVGGENIGFSLLFLCVLLELEEPINKLYIYIYIYIYIYVFQP
jgi:hypothetical protein